MGNPQETTPSQIIWLKLVARTWHTCYTSSTHHCGAGHRPLHSGEQPSLNQYIKARKRINKTPLIIGVLHSQALLPKNFESILDSRLATFTHENNTCTQAQYGGKRDHGTVDALYPLISHIQTRKLEGRVVYCAMLDFETSYHSVSRPQLYTYLH